MTSTSTLSMARTTKRFNKFVDFVSDIKIISGIGLGWFYEIKNAIIIGAGSKIIFELNTFGAIVITVLSLLGFYIGGRIMLPFYKRMNELNASRYNPQLAKISQIEKSLNNRLTS